MLSSLAGALGPLTAPRIARTKPVFWLQRGVPGSGTVWTDVVNGSNATLGTGATWANPDGVMFNGTSTGIGTGSAGALPQGTTNRTIAVRFKPTVVGGAVLFAWGTATTNRGQGLGIAAGSVGYFGWSNDFNVNTTIRTDAFNVLVGTFDGANVRVFFNGVLLGSTTKAWSTSGTNFYVARNISNAGFYNGIISDVQVYSSVLSDADIASLLI